MSSNRAQARRFAVAAPVGRDGELICALLNGSGFGSERVATIAEVAETESASLLGLILTDEALSGDGLDALRGIVDSQPDWSDLPVMLLTSGPREPRYSIIASQARLEIRSLVLLDRPVRKELLLSAVQMAHQARMKQLEMRDAADRQNRSDEALRNTEKLAMVGKLAATMAHEVNNPLEAIGNLLFLIEHCENPEDARSFSRMASRELERISEIVNHTLRFHRAPTKPSFVDVSELATSALALFRGKMRDRHIRESILARKTFAYCSAGEIRQALVNLIGNALDAMPDGGSLHVRVTTVGLSGSKFARLTVADTGTGIRQEIRSNLFTQFFTTKGSRGTGLGLWLTRDIVLRNCGKLRFRSRTLPPTGTVFSILLPASAPLDVLQSSGEARAQNAPATVEAA